MFEWLFGPSVVWALLVGNPNVVVGYYTSRDACVAATAGAVIANRGEANDKTSIAGICVPIQKR